MASNESRGAGDEGYQRGWPAGLVKLPLEFLPGKFPAGAVGAVLSGDIVVLKDPVERNAVLCLKLTNQPNQRIELTLGHFVFVKISNQADADSFFVHVHCIAVRSVHLMNPSVARLNLPIAGPAGPVVDDKVIPQAVPKSPPPVSAVKELRISDLGGAVMDDDVLPPLHGGKEGEGPEGPRRARDPDVTSYLKSAWV